MGKNLLTRILIAVFAIPLILYIVYLGGYYFLSLVGIIAGASLYELINIGKKYGLILSNIFGITTGLIILVEMYFYGFDYVPLTFVAIIILLLIVYLKSDTKNPFLELGFYIFSLFYIAIFLGCLILLREIPKLDYSTSGKLIITLLGIVWSVDTFAFFIGRKIGVHKIFRRISPKKSVEGAIAGIIGGFLFMLAAKYIFIEKLDLVKLVIITAVVVVFGQVGDFVESQIKRKAGLKDSSNLLLGHGGFLDRFDSLIFISPIVYFIVKFGF